MAVIEDGVIEISGTLLLIICICLGTFIGEFLKEYGIPLWNCTYIIDDGIEQTYFVPLYNGQTSLEITSLWFFHVSEGKIIYAPFRRDDPSIAGHEQCFVFDLLSYLVFGLRFFGFPSK